MSLDRWAVERAIRASALAPPSRLLLYTLLTRVSNGTLIIPAQYSPSLTTLTKETGLGRSTVADHLNFLERDGWLDRSRPSTKEALTERARTAYRIQVPALALAELESEPVQEPDQSGSRTSPGTGLVEQNEQEGLFSTSPRAGLVREPDGTSPGAGLNPMSLPMSSSPSEKKGGVGGNGAPKPKRKIATPAPDIFPVTDDMRSWAKSREITVDLNFETEQFLNKHRSKGNTFVDWLSAWRNWMGNAQNPPWANNRASTGTTGRASNGSGSHINRDIPLPTSIGDL